MADAELALVHPAQPGRGVAAAAQSRRLGMAVLSVIAGVAAVALLVASDSGARGVARSAMFKLEYYQPWQTAPTPAVNMQQLEVGSRSSRCKTRSAG